MGLVLTPEQEARAELERDPTWCGLEFLRCRDDLWYWATHYVWTWDSTARRSRPFPRHPYLETWFKLHQARMRGEYPNRPHLLIEKPRDMVFSVGCAVLMTHGLQFVDGWEGFAFSYLRKRVDDGGENSTPSSTFGKIRHVHKEQPAFLREFSPLRFKSGIIVNQRTGALLNAETAKDTGGRGLHGREGYGDEIGYIPHLATVIGSAEGATQHLTLGGTPNGEGTHFERLSTEAQNGEGAYVPLLLDFWMIEERRKCRNCGGSRLLGKDEDGITNDVEDALIEHLREDCQPTDGLHWSDIKKREHSPWLDAKEKSLTRELLEQEYFRSHKRSRAGLVWPIFGLHSYADDAMELRLEGWDHVMGWDYGVRDMASAGLVQRRGAQLEVLYDHETNEVSYEYWCNWYAWHRGEFHEWNDTTGKPERCIIAKLLDPRTRTAAERIFHDQWGEPGRWRKIRHITHVGDPSGKAVDSSLGSWEANLRKGAIWIIDGKPRAFGRIPVASAYSDIKGVVSETEKIQAIQYLLEKGLITLGPDAKHSKAALSSYHWPVNKMGKVNVGAQEPAHDAFSHSADRLGYTVIYLFGRLGSGGVPTGRSR